MKDIKCSQIGKLFVYIVPAMKLILMPVILTTTAGRDSYFSVALMYLLDIAMLTLLLFTLKNIGNVTLGDFLGRFSNWVKTPVLLLFALHFLLKTFMPLVEQKLFLEDSFYQKVSTLAFYVPVLILVVYIAVKNVKIFGRMGELLFFLVILSFGLLFVLSFEAFNLKELLPVLFNGVSPVLQGSVQIIFWFGDFLLMVFFFGRISDSENTFKKILVYAFVCMGLTILFMIFFTGIFGAVAMRQVFALSKISKYNQVLSEVGRFDWFAVLILLGGILFGTAINFAAAVQFIQDAFDIKKKTWITVGCGLAMLTGGVFFNDNFIALFDIYSNFIGFFFAFMQYAMPLILFGLSFAFRRSYEKVPQ